MCGRWLVVLFGSYGHKRAEVALLVVDCALQVQHVQGKIVGFMHRLLVLLASTWLVFTHFDVRLVLALSLIVLHSVSLLIKYMYFEVHTRTQSCSAGACDVHVTYMCAGCPYTSYTTVLRNVYLFGLTCSVSCSLHWQAYKPSSFLPVYLVYVLRETKRAHRP